MKILQLCKKLPYPLKDGESVAVTNLSKALKQLGCEITLLSMNTTKHYFNVKELPETYDHYHRIYTIDVDNRIKVKDAFANLFSTTSYHVSRFVNVAYKQQLIALLKAKQFDVIQLETLYLAPYISTIRQYSQAPIVMRAHNVEHEIWQRVAENTKFFPLKWYLQYLTQKLKKYEVSSFKDYDMLVAITQRDLALYKKLGFRKQATVTPVGIDLNDYTPDFEHFKSYPSIGFIGALDWIPNQEGLEWFLHNVWQHLFSRHPQLKFHIAGRHSPKSILELKVPQVVIHGEVPDAKAFMNQHSILIVPLLSGSGIRVKILEAMALGKVVITTSLGLEGIKAKNGNEIMVADSPEAFILCVEKCIQRQVQLEKIGRKARHFIRSEFDNLIIAHQLLHQYKKLIDKTTEQQSFITSKSN